MPPRKNKYYKKPKSSSVAAIARRVAKSTLKKEVELKHAYGNLNTTASTTMTLSNLTVGIALGTSDTNARVGDKITLKYMNIGFNFAVADTTNIMRVLLFQWNRNSDPTASEIFEDTSTIGQLTGALCRDSLNSKILKPIREWNICLNANQPNFFIGNKYISLSKNKPVNFIGGGSTAYNHIYLAYVSDSSAISHPVMQTAFTINYSDE